MALPTPGALLTGIWAAARVPFWLGGKRLLALMEPPAPGSTTASPAVPRGAVGAARRGVALLARVPGLPWRNTCLYRSVAECLVLRAYGVRAFVRIGVRNDGETRDIAAHAWVARAGEGAEAPAPTHNDLSHVLLARR